MPGRNGWLPFESNDTPEMRVWKQLDLPVSHRLEVVCSGAGR